MLHVLLLQQIMRAVKEYDLGLDVRTAAYICALEKIYNVYISAGITFWYKTHALLLLYAVNC